MRRGLAPLLLGAILLVAGPAAVRVQAETAEPIRGGSDMCLNCHRGDHIRDILATPHAAPGDPRTPFGGEACESCHGPGGAHLAAVMAGEAPGEIVSFGPEHPDPVPVQNAACLGCHDGDLHAWAGGSHALAEVACADCHDSHAIEDPMRRTAAQTRTCMSCHRSTAAAFRRAFHHPVRDDEMVCTDCHAAHGSLNPAMLVRPTLNQTCYECHAEKRGPFLWEHVPAAQDCSLCHRPHGSNHRGLLTKVPPLLCQECHARAGHPSVPRTPGGLVGGSRDPFLLAGSCTNCHSRVHGSNHPSGARLMR